MIKKCEVCNEDMECLRANKKYCSRKCENIARINRGSEKLTMERECPICKNIFTPKPLQQILENAVMTATQKERL